MIVYRGRGGRSRTYLMDVNDASVDQDNAIGCIWRTGCRCTAHRSHWGVRLRILGSVTVIAGESLSGGTGAPPPPICPGPDRLPSSTHAPLYLRLYRKWLVRSLVDHTSRNRRTISSLSNKDRVRRTLQDCSQKPIGQFVISNEKLELEEYHTLKSKLLWIFQNLKIKRKYRVKDFYTILKYRLHTRLLYCIS